MADALIRGFLEPIRARFALLNPNQRRGTGRMRAELPASRPIAPWGLARRATREAAVIDDCLVVLGNPNPRSRGGGQALAREATQADRQAERQAERQAGESVTITARRDALVAHFQARAPHALDIDLQRPSEQDLAEFANGGRVTHPLAEAAREVLEDRTGEKEAASVAVTILTHANLRPDDRDAIAQPISGEARQVHLRAEGEPDRKLSDRSLVISRLAVEATRGALERKSSRSWQCRTEGTGSIVSALACTLFIRRVP